MADKRWTIIVVPDGTGSSRSIEISQSFVKAILGMTAVFATAGLLLGIATLSRGINVSQSHALENENRLLEQELARVDSRLRTLADSVQVITTRDREIRLIAGLEPTDPTVQQAGIGGPRVNRDHLDALATAGPLGARAARARDDLDGLLRRAVMLSASFSEALDSVSASTMRLTRLPSILPADGYPDYRSYISSRFTDSRVHPIFHEARPHEGLDISAPLGSPIRASADGLVVTASQVVGFGNLIEIDHGNGIVTRYAHCEDISVRRGERVARGDQIATVGNTGVATAPHVHYEVLVRGRPVDPNQYILPPAIVD